MTYFLQNNGGGGVVSIVLDAYIFFLTMLRQHIIIKSVMILSYCYS